MVLVVTATAALASATAGFVSAGLLGGSLPAASFTYTSITDNAVNMSDPGTGDGIRFKTRDSVNVKTTYSRVVPSAALLGWHYHNGPVLVTVTVGTVTLYDDECTAIDVDAGHTYIESTGQVLNARIDPVKNAGIASVEWFTTRLYPAGTGDPISVAAPCTP